MRTWFVAFGREKMMMGGGSLGCGRICRGQSLGILVGRMNWIIY